MLEHIDTFSHLEYRIFLWRRNDFNVRLYIVKVLGIVNQIFKPHYFLGMWEYEFQVGLLD
jgi:hypothetical protein